MRRTAQKSQGRDTAVREKGNGLPVTTCTEAPPQVCTTNPGGAPASSTATAVNPQD